MKQKLGLKFSAKLLALGVVSLMVVGVVFATPVLDNGVLTYTVAADATETEANTFASYGTVTSVVKEGAGTLKLTVSNSSYGGSTSRPASSTARTAMRSAARAEPCTCATARS